MKPKNITRATDLINEIKKVESFQFCLTRVKGIEKIILNTGNRKEVEVPYKLRRELISIIPTIQDKTELYLQTLISELEKL